VAPSGRGAAVDEMLPLVRRLLAGDRVDYEGPAGLVEGIRTEPRPVQEPLEFWLGGIGPRALERCGRLGDGWLPSFCTPAEAGAGREIVQKSAEAAGREIDPEHFGVNVVYSREVVPDAALAGLARRARGNDPSMLVPVGRDALRRRIGDFVDAGITKFVVRPFGAPVSWQGELEALAADVVDLQS
jgi:probable F420-dependent oxidoreductase